VNGISGTPTQSSLSPTGVTPVPLYIVTGFLGSGKTTLLRRLLRVPGWERSAIMFNEFGEESLDHQLIQSGGHDPVVIKSGCVCCTMIEPLRQAFYDLFARMKRGERGPFDRILLETSGLSDPAPILSTLRGDHVLRDYVLPRQIVTTVDAVNAPAQIDKDPDFQKQVALADLVMVTKQDLVSRQALRRLRQNLVALNPTARFVDAGEPFELPTLLDCPQPVPSIQDETPRRRKASPGVTADGVKPKTPSHGSIKSFTLIYDQPIDWSAFAVWLTLLLHKHGEAILRVKGILNVDDFERPLVIHGVQHIMHPPVHLEDWPSPDRRSKIVFIVRGIEPDVLRQSLDRFLAWTETAAGSLGSTTSNESRRSKDFETV